MNWKSPSVVLSGGRKILKTPVLENHEILLAFTNVKEENDLSANRFDMDMNHHDARARKRFCSADIPIVYLLKSYRPMCSLIYYYSVKMDRRQYSNRWKFEYDHLSASGWSMDIQRHTWQNTSFFVKVRLLKKIHILKRDAYHPEQRPGIVDPYTRFWIRIGLKASSDDLWWLWTAAFG